MIRVFTSVTGIVLLSKALGFIKQMVTASAFGATIETDLINLSQGLIGNIKYVLAQVLLTSFLTVYIRTRERNEEEAGRFATDSIKAFLLVTGVISGLLIIFASGIAKIIAPTYGAEQSAQLARYLQMFAPMLLAFVVTSVCHSLLNAHERFILGHLEGVNQSVILIVLILTLKSTLGIQTLIVAFFAYSLWDAVFLGALSRRYFLPSRGNPFHNSAVVELLHMSGPLLLGYSMVYINQQVDKILVSGLPVGTVTAMGYAALLSDLIGTVIASLASILFTYIATEVSKGNDEAAAMLAIRSMMLMVTAFLPISIISVLCAEDVVAIVFQHGAFQAESVRIAAEALMGYSVMFPAMVLREVFSRLIYAYQDSKRPMVNSTIGIVFNIVLSVALCPAFGVFGVTFASSISVLVCGALNVFSAKKHNAFLNYKGYFQKLIWLSLGGVVCVMTAQWGVEYWQSYQRLIRFILVTLTAGGVYFLVISPLLWDLIRKGLK